MDYIVVSTSKCLYQEWQLRLLKWSIDKVKQKGKVIFLTSFDHNHFSESVNFDFPGVEIIELPDWAKEWEVKDGKWWGGIPNKYESISWLCKNKNFNNDDRILFLDPDMLFLEPVDLYPKNNEVIGQKWINYTKLSGKNSIQPDGEGIMYPFAINFFTLKKIIKDYKTNCINIRKETNLWESEMWGLHLALEQNGVRFILDENLGRCTVWNENNSSIKSKILHYPNKIESLNNKNLFFKQDYTFNPTQKIKINDARNTTDTLLLSNIDQERTDYIYENKWNFPHLFKFYTGDKGYFFLHPWSGGWNNIRMSFELAICISYLTNRTLILPPAYNWYLCEGDNQFSDYFEMEDLGIKYMSFEDFCDLKDIEPNIEKLKENSKIVDYDAVINVINYEKIPIPTKFLKGRKELRSSDVFPNDEILYSDRKLLGNFYLNNYTKHETSLKQLIAKYVIYRNDLRDLAWRFINYLGDQTYYSIHIRRNDFQYKDLFITGEEIFENIKNLIPLNSRLYISTDEKDEELFKTLNENYQIIFYKDVASQLKLDEFDENWVPLIEQLICTRSIKFIGNKNSTLSSYVHKLRYFMDDIEDTSMHQNHTPSTHIYSDSFWSDTEWSNVWAREYKEVGEFNEDKILVSIASYRDSQIFDTLKSLYDNVSNPNRLKTVVHLQDDKETYNKLQTLNYPGLEIIFTPAENTLGVVWARNRIKDKYTNEKYFLTVDSHSRFKENWDLILIHQYNSIEEPKVILTTYPNHFDVPDNDKRYLKLAYNTPLKIKGFIHPKDPEDNRCKAENLPSLKDYEVKDTRWVTAGFSFTSGEWVKEVQTPEPIVFSGEEDITSYLSYLKGYNIKIASEATVWHNYNFKDTNDVEYRTPNDFEGLTDEGAKKLNEILFKNDPEYVRSVEDVEKYFNIKFKRPSTSVSWHDSNSNIFVSIASFKDYEIRHTILDCINKAYDPQNLHFGICLQYDNSNPLTSENILDDLVDKYNIKISKHNWNESEGGCWARQISQQFYNNEKYSLQVDAHTRFIQNWDKLAIKEFNNLLSKSAKPLISFLPPGYRRDDKNGIDYEFIHLNDLQILNVPTFREITSQYWPVYGGYQDEKPTNNFNQNVPLLYGGFIFTWGYWVQEIEQDPNHYYTGEEFAIALRSYTSGYDIYLPTQILAWHRIHPQPPAKHINSFSNHHEKHINAINRLERLVRREGNLGKYDLGKERTLQDYEKFANIDLLNNKVL